MVVRYSKGKLLLTAENVWLRIVGFLVFKMEKYEAEDSRGLLHGAIDIRV